MSNRHPIYTSASTGLINFWCVSPIFSVLSTLSTMRCKICEQNIVDDDIECGGVCDRRFHVSCVKLNSDQVRVIKNTPGVFWCCCDCSNPICKILLSKLDGITKAVPTGINTTSTTAFTTKRRSLSLSGTIDKVPPKPITPIQRLTRNQAKSKPKQPVKNVTIPATNNKPEPRLSTVLPPTAPKKLIPDSNSSDATESIASKDTASNEAPVLAASSTNEDNCIIEDCEITAAPPTQWLYISRCSITTTADNVRSYITKKLGLVDNSSISCRQLLKKDTDINSLEFVSFKVRVPPCHLDTTKSHTFWPDGIVVKNFIARPNFRQTTSAGTQL